MFAKLNGSSAYLPEKIISNDTLSLSLDTSHEWIKKRTGIHNRHILADNETAASMAIRACAALFDRSSLQPTDISAVIVACSTAASPMPSIACHICNHFSISGAFALDINAACSGFLYALSLANDRIKTHQDQHVLVIGVDAMSRVIDWKDRQTAVLFGDGAGCVLLSQSDTPGLFAIDCRSESFGADLLGVTGDVHSRDNGYLSMHGKEVFKFAVDTLATTFLQFIEKHKLEKSSIDWLIPHQANTRILDLTAKKIGFDPDKIIKTLKEHANTSAASVPLALHSGIENGQIQPGNLLVLQSFGAGFTWGIAAIQL